MSEDQRPRTAEQLGALPIGPKFGVLRHEITDAERESGYVEINGKPVTVPDGIRFIDIPTQGNSVLFWSDDTDVISWTDADGARWALGRYSDGRWFKRRS